MTLALVVPKPNEGALDRLGRVISIISRRQSGHHSKKSEGKQDLAGRGRGGRGGRGPPRRRLNEEKRGRAGEGGVARMADECGVRSSIGDV